MSLADEFVKRLAAVECDHTVTIEIGYPADAVGPDGKVYKADRRPPEIRAAEAKAAAEARCVFCIARATITATGECCRLWADGKTKHQEGCKFWNYRCGVCGSADPVSHFGPPHN